MTPVSDADYNIEMNVDATDSVGSVKKLRDELEGATHDVLRLSQKAEAHIKKMTADLRAALKAAKLDKDQAEFVPGIQRKLEGAHARTLQSISNTTTSEKTLKSKDAGRIDAVVKNHLFKLNNDLEQAGFRIAQGQYQAFARSITATTPVLMAKAQKIQRQTSELLLKEGNAALLAAETQLKRAAEQMTVMKADPRVMAATRTAQMSRMRNNTAYWSDPTLVASGDTRRSVGNMRQRDTWGSPDWVNSMMARSDEQKRRQIGTFGNDRHMELRDQKWSRDQATFDREQSDVNLQKAKNLRREASNEKLKFTMLNTQWVDLTKRLESYRLSKSMLNGQQDVLDAQLLLNGAANRRTLAKADPLNLDTDAYFSQRGMDRRQAFFLNDSLRTADDNLYNVRQTGRMNLGNSEVGLNALLNRDRINLTTMGAKYGDNATANLFEAAKIRSIQQEATRLADLDGQKAKTIKGEVAWEKQKQNWLDADWRAANAERERVGTTGSKLRWMTPGYGDAVLADQKTATDTKIRRQDPAYQAGLAARTSYAEKQTIREGQVGRYQTANESTLARISSNDGADMMAIQTRILVGYQVISTAFNALRGMTSFVVELDKEFKQFQAITGTTSTEMKGLEDRLIKVSEATKFTALEVAQAATILGQAGLSAREVGESIEAVTLLATAAGTELAPAVDLVTSTLSIFNLQTSQTADIANTMTAAINGSKLTIDKLALGFQYAGNIAAQVGISYQELTATLGALANSGIKAGSTLGTGLRQLLVDLETPTEKFTDRLRKLGLTQQDVDVKSKGLVSVMNTLKDAGFGTAEAFESFEVRAAATFSALGNNLDLVIALERNFILSSAAAEANAIQMESLANTFAQLNSVTGTIVYKAFRPFVDMLQDVASVTASVLSVLGQFPGLLQLVSVGFVAVGVAISASAFGAMFKGLALGLPIISAFTASMWGAEAATTAVGVASSRTARLISALFAVVAKNPFVMAVAGVAALATAFYAFGKTSTDTLDAAKAKVNEMAGEVDTATTKMTAINQALVNVIARRDELNKDPLLREVKILEVIQQFKELGIQIDATTSSVDQLVQALNDLNEMTLGDKIKFGNAQIAAEVALIAELKAQSAEKRNDQRGGLITRGQRFLTSADRAFQQANWGNEGLLAERGFHNRFAGEAAKSEIGAIASVITGQAAPDNRLTGNIAVVEQALAEMVSNQRTMSLSGQRTDDLDEKIDLLVKMLAEARAVNADEMAIRSSTSNVEVLTRGLAVDEASLLLRQNGMEDTATALSGKFQSGVNFAKDNAETNQTSVADDLIEAMDLKADFDADMDAFAQRVAVLKAAFVAANPGQDGAFDSAVEQLLAGLEIPNLRNSVSDHLEASTVRLASVDEATREAWMKEQEKETQKQMKSLSNTVNREGVDSIATYIDGAMQRKRMMVNEVYDAKQLQEHDKAAKEILEQERQAALDTIDEEEQTYAERLAERRKDIIVGIYKGTEDALDVEIKDLTDRMKAITDEMKKTNPGAMMDALIAQWNDLNTQLAGAMTSRENVQLGIAAYDQGGVSSSISSVVDKIIGVESGGKANAKNPNSSALGLGQFVSGTWLAMMQKYEPLLAQLSRQDQLDLRRDPALNRKMTERYATENRDNLIANGLTPTDAGIYASHFLGPGTAVKVMKADANTPIQGLLAPGQYAANRSIFDQYTTAGEVMQWSAKKMGGVKQSVPQQLAEEQATMEDAVYTGEVRAQRATTSIGVRADNKEVEGILAAAKTSSDPAAVEGAMAGIDAVFNDRLAKKVDLFKIENRKALAENDPIAMDQLAELIEQENTERATKIGSLVDDYGQAATEVIEEPLVDARRRLEEARRPQNEGKFTQEELRGMEREVANYERANVVKAVEVAENKLSLTREALADATARSGKNSAEAAQWTERLTQAEKDLKIAVEARDAMQAAADREPMSRDDAFYSARSTWALNSGFYKQDDMGMLQMKTAAEQMEDTWMGVFDALNSGFTKFYSDLASGNVSIKDSFKGLGVAVAEEFQRMIIRALAFQAVQAMIGDPSAGSTGFGGFLKTAATALFTVPTAPGAANGELISSGIPNRDSTLRKVMPGEMILRQSAVSAIGKDKLVSLNNMGNRSLSTTAPEAMGEGQGGGGMVNVYVVSPDNVPSMGPNDVLAVVADNISRKGSIRQLIKSVQMGAA
jgi:TP901 family phage tail tape measure protein